LCLVSRDGEPPDRLKPQRGLPMVPSMVRPTIRPHVSLPPASRRSRGSLMPSRPSLTPSRSIRSRAMRPPSAAAVHLPTRSRHRRRPGRTTLLIGGATVLIAGTGAALASATAQRAVRRLMMRVVMRRPEMLVRPEALDELTGLANRPETVRLLADALHRARVRSRRLAVLYVDIDDFSECNDAYGEPAGDHVLQVSAARMQAQLRSGDVVCRIGGDDFLVIMEPAGPDHMITRIGQRIVDAIAQPITYDGESILISASIGISVASEGETEPGELVSEAKGAVDRARASGTHIGKH
jgi:diguanylate cyclase (GGDEF)-like protein